MRILAIVHMYPPAHGAGAEWMLHTILRRMVELGHHVAVACLHAEEYTLDGVHVRLLGDTSGDAALVADHDLVFTHLDLTKRAVAAARRARRPIVHLVHNDSQLRHFGVRPDPGTLAVFNSQWLAGAYDWWSGESVVCRPHVRVADYRTDPGEYVTLLNLSPAKGAHVFYDMARHLPDHRFLGVLGVYGQQVTRPQSRNMTFQRNTPNVRDDVYARTRVLLMPSSYESWGRVAIEAACSGIPTVAAPTPGLLESLNEAGIYAERGARKAWVEAVRCLDDPDEYRYHSELVRARAVELEAQTGADIDALVARCEALVADHPPPRSRPGPLRVAVLVPLDDDTDGKRACVWAHLADRWAAEHPTWRIVTGRAPAGRWSKGGAFAEARSAAGDVDVIVATDADVFCDPAALREAVDLVASGEAAWTVPYSRVVRYSQGSTADILNGSTPRSHAYERPPYPGQPGGGIVVVTAQDWDRVGGIDPRFVGWGGEDIALGLALDTLVGEHRRLPGTLAHLFHPHQVGAMSPRPAQQDSARLLAQYRRAAGDVAAMRALVAEAGSVVAGS